MKLKSMKNMFPALMQVSLYFDITNFFGGCDAKPSAESVSLHAT